MPNIVLILADDLGYGDVSCMNPSSRIRTTAIDALAAEGMRFTDAHSTSAVCSPSRYSVLTGRYNWRSTLQRGIVGVYGDPLIDADRLTLPRMLQKRGYHTAAIGKWHLGMGWDFEPDEENFFPGGGRQATDGQRDRWRAAFDKPTIGGPCTRGFDAYFGVDVPNWPPYAFIEDDRLVGVPSELLPDRLVGNNLASYSGPAMPYWHFEQLLPAWAHRADAYIADRARSDEPFFLYLALTSPHTPLSVNKPWIGASGLNSLYADLVLETDHVVGQVMESLDRYGLSDSTLVIFTSDNGCAPYIGVAELEAQGHRPSAEYRGYKSDAWDGGHRVPFIVRWPGKVAAGTTQSALVSQTDLMATMAQVVGASLPANAGEDSYSMMPLLTEGAVTTRGHAVHHSISGKFAVRTDRWKLILCPGSGGWTLDDADAADDGLPMIQLYDMEVDPQEANNLHVDRPDKVRDLLGILEQLVADGRSTPGEQQQNDAQVDIWKLDTIPGADLRFLDDY